MYLLPLAFAGASIQILGFNFTSLTEMNSFQSTTLKRFFFFRTMIFWIVVVVVVVSP